MKKLIIIQTTTPDYRKNVYQYIKNELGDSFDLYAGDSYFEASVKTDSSISFRKPLRNHYFFKRKILIQTGFWKEVFKKNVIILEMNPRILSNWILLIIRRLLRRKSVLWGHAWPRAGKKSKSDSLRNIMRLLGNEIIVYTKSQEIELQEKMPNKKIIAAPNAVFFKNQMIVSKEVNLIDNLIYVGRLTKTKKALFLVKTFHKTLKDLPNKTKLFIVGEGEEKSLIIKYIKTNNLESRIKVLGHIGSYEKLRDLYNTSLISVSPGYVGLSITQSFGFGVPMIISKDENHSPEIEAVKNGENALFYNTDDFESLSERISEVFSNKIFWLNKRADICKECQENYSIEAMGQTFINTVK